MLPSAPLPPAASAPDAATWVHYLPIATTAIAVPFTVALLRRYRAKGGGAHLLWWAAGVVCYGLGTALESTITLLGNSAGLTRLWYVAGALLGAYPLAQGSVYLLASRRWANRLTWLTLPAVAALAACVLASPVRAEALEAHRPSGAVLGWTWIRYATPFLNLYAVLFLVGGATRSAWRFARTRDSASRALGNALIAGGALLPAVGGAYAKSGLVEALYVGELLGLLLIFAGFRLCTRERLSAAAHATVGG